MRIGVKLVLSERVVVLDRSVCVCARARVCGGGRGGGEWTVRMRPHTRTHTVICIYTHSQAAGQLVQ